MRRDASLVATPVFGAQIRAQCVEHGRDAPLREDEKALRNHDRSAAVALRLGHQIAQAYDFRVLGDTRLAIAEIEEPLPSRGPVLPGSNIVTHAGEWRMQVAPAKMPRHDHGGDHAAGLRTGAIRPAATSDGYLRPQL